MPENRAAVSAAINERLGELDISPEQLAERSGLDRSTIRQILHQPDKHRPTRATLKAISEALDWPSGHLRNVLIDRPQQEETEQVKGDATRLSNLESRISVQEQLLRKLAVLIDQRLGSNIVDVIYEIDR